MDMGSADSKRVLIAGASGLIGQAALTHFEAAADWEVIAVSRRLPRIAHPDRVLHVPLDLTDRAACAAAVASLPAVSHLVYCAVYEAPALVAGWCEQSQMLTNRDMLCNLVDPLIRAGRLRHVSLLQGTKAYGAHLHAVRIPARESQPRDPHDNFYWLQEDYLRAQCDEHDLAMTILRPQVVFGDVAGVAMSLIPVIGAYAAIRKAEGRPFSFPGGPAYPLEAVDARLLAQVLAWAAESPAAVNETFNVTNGDVFVWQNVWPALAHALGVEPGEPEPMSMARDLPRKAAVWRQVAERHALRCTDLHRLLGYSHHYADFCFAYGADRRPPPALVSTIKLRQAGFGGCIDTEQMFAELVASMQALRLLPSPHHTCVR